MRHPKFTPVRVMLGATAGLVLALFMDMGGPGLSRLGQCIGFGTGAGIGIVISAYSDFDLFRPKNNPPAREP
jgi:hypothetical protein